VTHTVSVNNVLVLFWELEMRLFGWKRFLDIASVPAVGRVLLGSVGRSHFSAVRDTSYGRSHQASNLAVQHLQTAVTRQ